jgi:PP-loop superfamily ATP-utilizing enzyme
MEQFQFTKAFLAALEQQFTTFVQEHQSCNPSRDTSPHKIVDDFVELVQEHVEELSKDSRNMIRARLEYALAHVNVEVYDRFIEVKQGDVSLRVYSWNGTDGKTELEMSSCFTCSAEINEAANDAEELENAVFDGGEVSDLLTAYFK